MKRNTVDFLKIGIVVPAMVLSLAACGASGGSAAQTPAAGETASTGETSTTGETTVTDQGGAGQETGSVQMFENKGIKLSVPSEYVDLLLIEVPEISEDGILINVYEKASVDAEKAMGHDREGAGWLFAIGTRTEEEVHNMLCNDMSGEEILGTDGSGTYYIYFHPTDVRFVRESPENMVEGQEQWDKLNEWAGAVRKETFFKDNEGITQVNLGNTLPEMYLARAAYMKDVKYTISTTEFGPVEPNGADIMPFYEKMTSNAVYEYVDGEAPDGEYVVLDFPEDGERFDFFFATDKGNIVRRVSEGGSEELYKITFADDSIKACDVMNDWYHAYTENK